MIVYVDVPAEGTVYDRARRWLIAEGILTGRALDDHQTWALIEAHFPGGWDAFRANQGEPPA